MNRSNDFYVRLFPHQKDALARMRNGCILCGGTGSGKSITSIAYYWVHESLGRIESDGHLIRPSKLKPIYIITTAAKRDSGEWKSEYGAFGIEDSDVVVDSWNNIHKYENISDSFFIFDEHHACGTGAWSKSFIKISRLNDWIILTATPGDSWMDYIPVFIANGFYKNKSEFTRNHVIWNRYSKYPKPDKFTDVGTLEHYRRMITVKMTFKRETKRHYINLTSDYDKATFKQVYAGRWDPYKNEPIQDAAGACYIMRRVVNSDPSRLDIIRKLLEDHRRIIIFYNFDYELDILRTLSDCTSVYERNGHKHDKLPTGPEWVYLVQYASGSEGWNCTTTDAIIFYSQNYSYKAMTQAAGRIDRLNTSYTDLYYYTIQSKSPIDISISRALNDKKNFNERDFYGQIGF